jgi:hypothetical protein
MDASQYKATSGNIKVAPARLDDVLDAIRSRRYRVVHVISISPVPEKLSATKSYRVRSTECEMRRNSQAVSRHTNKARNTLYQFPAQN